jgi:2-polyprenyl-6-methoxyphenol hydroxylase-like FAD-dependent oxidoreductase
MEHEATGLIRQGNTVAGTEVRTPGGPLQIFADLVIGCDGRHSTTRPAAQLMVQEFGVPIDVLWFHISRTGNDPEQLFGNINFGKVLILINRGDYFQAGLIVPKNSFDGIKQAGLDSFRHGITAIAPYLGDRVHEIKDWNQVKLLSVQINRLRQWHSAGVLCIGDAAHAMSPAGGVGINLAIQDAVASARILSQALRARSVTGQELAAVQRRREFPTRVTQQLQINAHKVFAGVFRNPGPLEPPPILKAIVKIPGLQHLMARVIGLGIRPEHIRPASGWEAKLNHILRRAAILGAVSLAAFVLTRRRAAS